MNPDVKELWVKTLKSGRFKKGRQWLQQDGKFCCLGVLCELAIEDGVDIPVSESNGAVCYDGSSGALPDAVMEWAGLDECDPMVPTSTGVERLSILNDGDRLGDIRAHRHREIAKLIEADL